MKRLPLFMISTILLHACAGNDVPYVVNSDQESEITVSEDVCDPRMDITCSPDYKPADPELHPLCYMRDIYCIDGVPRCDALYLHGFCYFNIETCAWNCDTECTWRASEDNFIDSCISDPTDPDPTDPDPVDPDPVDPDPVECDPALHPICCGEGADDTGLCKGGIPYCNNLFGLSSDLSADIDYEFGTCEVVSDYECIVDSATEELIEICKKDMSSTKPEPEVDPCVKVEKIHQFSYGGRVYYLTKHLDEVYSNGYTGRITWHDYGVTGTVCWEVHPEFDGQCQDFFINDKCVRDSVIHIELGDYRIDPDRIGYDLNIAYEIDSSKSEYILAEASVELNQEEIDRLNDSNQVLKNSIFNLSGHIESNIKVSLNYPDGVVFHICEYTSIMEKRFSYSDNFPLVQYVEFGYDSVVLNTDSDSVVLDILKKVNDSEYDSYIVTPDLTSVWKASVFKSLFKNVPQHTTYGSKLLAEIKLEKKDSHILYEAEDYTYSSSGCPCSPEQYVQWRCDSVRKEPDHNKLTISTNITESLKWFKYESYVYAFPYDQDDFVVLTEIE